MWQGRELSPKTPEVEGERQCVLEPFHDLGRKPTNPALGLAVVSAATPPLSLRRAICILKSFRSPELVWG
jgi:hypothetical protein